ncbi:MAG TPA: GNAT family acetyltransferase [Flavobacteriaceae bacterium]|nr:GNAT family acetyltransferase [Flavobacteriaceae bacterium]
MLLKTIATKEDIPGVLLLQEKYLFKNMSVEERAEGFVTTPFTETQIEDILKQNGLFVAKKKHEVVAYIFAADWKYFEQWEIFNYMVSRFPNLSFQGQALTTQNTFQYGPVCIDKKFRGQGLFNELFEEMRVEFKKRFPISITFINKINAVSTAAHTKKLGWEIIDEFEFNSNQYLALALDMNKSVLTQS